MFTDPKLNKAFLAFVCFTFSLIATGCGKESASPEKLIAARSPSPASDQLNYQVQTATPTSLQSPASPPAAPSDTENQYRLPTKGDPFLLAATASGSVLAPVPSSALSSAKSLEEASELIRRQAQEPPAIAVGMNPFTLFSTTQRNP